MNAAAADLQVIAPPLDPDSGGEVALQVVAQLEADEAHVAPVLQQHQVAARHAAAVDGHGLAAVGAEGDEAGGFRARDVDAHLLAIGPGADVDGAPGRGRVGGLLHGPPGLLQRPRAQVVAGGSHETSLPSLGREKGEIGGNGRAGRHDDRLPLVAVFGAGDGDDPRPRLQAGEGIAAVVARAQAEGGILDADQGPAQRQQGLAVANRAGDAAPCRFVIPTRGRARPGGDDDGRQAAKEIPAGWKRRASRRAMAKACHGAIIYPPPRRANRRSGT